MIDRTYRPITDKEIFQDEFISNDNGVNTVFQESLGAV